MFDIPNSLPKEQMINDKEIATPKHIYLSPLKFRLEFNVILYEAS